MTIQTIIQLVVAGILGVLFLAAVASSLFVIEQQHKGVIERFGKFHKMADPGLGFKLPFIDQVAYEVSLQVQELVNAKGGPLTVETKTSDDVTVTLGVVIQYHVIKDKVYEAVYQLEDAEEQMKTYVYDAVRSKVPKMPLDDVFSDKDAVADFVKLHIQELMTEYGYQIKSALITYVEPDEKVKQAMNEINAAKRMRVASTEKAEAERILKVAAASAEAEAKALQGKGIADQRKAIVDGLKNSVTDFQQSVQGSTPQDVMNLVLMTQFFDTLKEVGADSKCSTVFIPYTPGGLSDITSQIRNAMLQSKEVA